MDKKLKGKHQHNSCEISVIIPSYHPQEYLKKCLVSLSRQSFKSTIEVIIVLNGEKEPYYSQIMSWKDGPLREVPLHIIHTEKKGVSNARNLGINDSHGKYIVFIDDDDYVSNVFLERLFEKIESTADANIAQSNFKTNKYGEICNDYISHAYEKLINKRYSIFRFRKFLSSVCGKIYTKEVIGEARFKENLKISEDSVFLFEISKNIRRIALAEPDCVYFRSVRLGSAMRSHRPLRIILGNYVCKFKYYTNVYFSNPFKYSFLLYISRLLAISKVLFAEIKNNGSKRI